MHFSKLSSLGLLLALLAAVGCSPSNQSSLGTVTGTLHIDGKPARAGINLEFDPVEKGVRGSTATTDDSGQFEAIYSLTRNGVRLGPCVVKLVPPEAVPTSRSAKRKLPFPDQYYEEIQQVDITSGYNTIELAISTSGN
ncbi:hypothetical protein [Blastopirellula retiformator]|uniref:Carboxypeptidase regulatory-like domain-containing protein n=1 Tax=Blastopirellula retiformator TaxID=2527970 RepID=A0A5C5VLG0_9BACT|nr:hypothetical protein [Blastopirellula retiformator]TWT39464.1 hypothetical protein Enr8_11630 [Blastopirellula retiformator]